MILQTVSLEGTINQVIRAFLAEAVNFIQMASWFRPIYVISDV